MIPYAEHVADTWSGEEISRMWGSWEEIDERGRWLRKVRDGGKETTVDLVEIFFSNLDLA